MGTVPIFISLFISFYTEKTNKAPSLSRTPYLGIDIFLIKETQKAILIEFDGKKAWFPKSWILKIKRVKDRHVIASQSKADEAIAIKITEYHWTKKFI